MQNSPYKIQIYPTVKKADPITTLFNMMNVSRSAYYQFIRSQATKEISGNLVFIFKIKEEYGSRCMAQQFRNEGYPAGRSKTRRLMKKAGVFYEAKKKFKLTTNSHHPFPDISNLLNRDFHFSARNKQPHPKGTVLG